MSKKILVIEDTKEVRENIAEILESEGFEPISAENGEIGIALAGKTQPDLILCDIMMPGIDGYEVLEILRKNILTSTTPFIFLTAKNTREDHRRGMSLGADDYISKPFTIEELVNSVQTRLKKTEEFRKKSEARLNELTRNLGMPIVSVIQEPLRAIIGFSHMVMTEYPNMEKPEIADLMALVYKAGMKLNTVVRKTLLFYQLEGLLIQNEKQRNYDVPACTRPSEIITQIARQTALNHQRGADLFLVAEPGPALPVTDEHLRMITEELVENALLYSPRRSPVKVFTGHNAHHFTITVTDEGIGMSQEQIQSIGAFHRFRTDFSKHEGMGLGLTLVKQILELYNGQWQINSESGLGTTIKISFPVAQ